MILWQAISLSSFPFIVKTTTSCGFHGNYQRTNKDIEAITQVTIAAFENHPISHQTEHFIINALRAAGALTISLVAEIDGQVVGHIAFSPIAISDDTTNWYGMGPVSVLPAHQKQGIGTALIDEGLSLLKILRHKLG